MGPVGAPEILVVLVVALIVLGPNRLPDAARSVGRAFRELRRVTSGFQDEMRGALDPEPEYPTSSTTPAGSWVSTEEPASMTVPGSATSPQIAETDVESHEVESHGEGEVDGNAHGRPEGGEPPS